MGRCGTRDLEPQPRSSVVLADLVRQNRWNAPVLPPVLERRREHANHTKALPRAAIERQLTRRDIPLREKTLWRMLYETAARAHEILALERVGKGFSWF